MDLSQNDLKQIENGKYGKILNSPGGRGCFNTLNSFYNLINL